MNVFAKITARTMKRSKMRSIVTIIGVILASAMITGVMTLGYSVQKFMIEYAKEVDGDWHFYEGNLSKKDAEELEKNEAFSDTAMIRELGFANLKIENGWDSNYLYIQTINKDAEEMLRVTLSRGRFPENENEIILQEYSMENLGKKIGDQITLDVGDATLEGGKISGNDWPVSDEDIVFKEKYERTYTIVGVLEHWGNSNGGGLGADAFTGEVLDETHQKEDEGSGYYVYARLKNPYKVDQTVKQLEKTMPGGTNYGTNESVLKWMGASVNRAYVNILSGVVVVLIGIVAVGAIFLIYNAFSISLRERTVQLGIIASVGASNRQIRKSMWYEAVIAGIIGIPIGIAGGILGISITLSAVGRWLTSWLRGQDRELKVAISPLMILVIVIIVFAILCVAVWIPVRRSKRISPLEAIRSTKDVKISRRQVKTPVFIRRHFGIEAVFADKNFKRDRRKHRATILSLTVSIILFSSASLYSEYLMGTSQEVLKVPEYQLVYETTYDMEELKENESNLEKIKQLAEDSGKVEDIKEYYSQSVEVESGESGIMLVYLPDEEFYRYAGDGAKDAVYNDETVEYDDVTGKYREYHAFEGKGDFDINVYTSEYKMTEDGEYVEHKGEKKTIKLGKYINEIPEYANVSGCVEIFLPESKMKENLVVNSEGSIMIRQTISIQTKDYDQIYEKLNEEIGKDDVLQAGILENPGHEYERSQGINLAIKVLTYGFTILISLIVAAGVFNTISTNVLLRKREFAVLESVGMTQKMLKKMLNYECMCYVLRAMFWGAIGSCGMSFLIWLVIQSGYTDGDFIIPWKQILIALVWVSALVFMTMKYSFWKIKGQNIIEELKKE